jgi:hypothetical protein
MEAVIIGLTAMYYGLPAISKYYQKKMMGQKPGTRM